MATPCELMMTSSQGTPSAAVEGNLTEADEELNRHGNKWLKAMNKDIIHSQGETGEPESREEDGT